MIKAITNYNTNKAEDHFYRHNNAMRRHCQFTVKRPEKSGVLTVAPEQQPCGV